MIRMSRHGKAPPGGTGCAEARIELARVTGGVSTSRCSARTAASFVNGSPGASRSAAAARCIADPRNPLLITHAVRDMLRQRVYGLALGWEDLNDHKALRLDVAMQTAVGVDREVASASRAPAGQLQTGTGPPGLRRSNRPWIHRPDCDVAPKSLRA